MSDVAESEPTRHPVLVIGAASVGTVFEWYDFYLYASLLSVITKQFFSGVNDTTGYILALLAFGAGFVVRPVGAIIFGRLGDIWGRKNTFLVTMMLMGLSTFVVGLLPSYQTAGLVAPVALVCMRLIQGLALGGEYGGAATYVAEQAPAGKRGLYTSFIQLTATFGLMLSLVVILITRKQLGEATFGDWGWRVPFLVSAVLLVISMLIRLKLHESPLFEKMIAQGKGSKQPLTDSFGRWSNLKIVLLALMGLTAGDAVVWYTGQFYSLTYLEKILQVDGSVAESCVAVALLLGTPFFVLFGWLSDKIGRKWIIMTGCALAALTYFPIFHALTDGANPVLARAQKNAVVTVVADPHDCSFQFDPIGKAVFSSSCDVAKSYLAKAGVPYKNEAAYKGQMAGVQIGDCETCYTDSFRGEHLSKKDFDAARKAFGDKLGAALADAGYPAKADSALVNKPEVVGILFILVLYATMVHGPLAAMLVEMFPTRIRYTSISLPYHIGNGWFGGFLPTVAFAMVAATGNIYYGLWYPIFIAGLTVIIGGINLANPRNVDIEA